MNILFLSYMPISLGEEQIRTVAILRTLADAGHHIDLIAPFSELSPHSNIHIITKKKKKLNSKHDIHSLALIQIKKNSYSVIHAVDEVVFFVYRISRWKKIPFIYDARRRFTGKSSQGTLRRYRFFATYYNKKEKKILKYATCVLSSCPQLSNDLKALYKDLSLVEIKDIPLQPLYEKKDLNSEQIFPHFKANPITHTITCYALSKNSLRNLMLTARKIIDTLPTTGFFLQTPHQEQAKKIAKSLDISNHCQFLEPDKPLALISALAYADAVFYIPPENLRYIPQSLYTALNVFNPLVVVQNKAYETFLTSKTAHFVLSNPDSMANGLLDVLQEPLFSVSIATEGQKLIRSHYTFASFKHKLRMAYKKYIPPK